MLLCLTAANLISIAAILVGPLASLTIVRCLDKIRDKRRERYALFKTLMSHKHKNPTPSEAAQAFNTIELVFHGEDEIVNAWHNLQDELTLEENDVDKVNSRYIELLSTMSKKLEYTGITKEILERRYTPNDTKN